MKKISIYLIAIFLISGMIVSCSDDFLESTPYGNMSGDLYFQTPDAGMKTVAYCYAPMWADFPFSINKVAIGNEITDDADVGGSDPGDRPQIPNVATGKPLTSNALLLETWSNRFDGISRCNYGIDGISQEGVILKDPNGNDVPETTKSRYISEMKFLRAFYYFDLVTTFGSVPLLTKPSVVEDKHTVTNATIEALREQLYQDLDACITDINLPRAKDMPGEELGRVSKDAALAFKARVALFFAGMMSQGKVSGDAAAEYVLAKNAAEEVITNGGFELIADYQNLFRGDYFTGTQSKECIFTVLRTWIPDLYIGGDAFPIMNSGRNEVGGWGGDCPTTDLADEYEVGDPRKLYTIISHLDTFPRLDGTKEIHDYSGYYDEFSRQQSRKAFVPDVYRNECDLTATNWSPYYIRYADVLLMDAEAILQTGGALSDVAGLINEVRYRAFVSSSKVDEEALYRKFQGDLFPIDDAKFNSTYKIAVTTKEDLLLAIKHERRVELGMEGFRFVDLLRWGDYVSVMQAFYGKYGYAGKGRDVTDQSWPFPIPQVEIDRSGGSIKQNPNY